MKYLAIALSLTAISLCSALRGAFESEEKLALRRILVLYQEEEFTYAEKAIEEFFQRYPHSVEADQLFALQGDIAFEGKDFEKALHYYKKISSSQVQASIQRRKWHSLFSLAQFKQLSLETKPLIENEELARLYFAKCALQMALRDTHNKEALLNLSLDNFKKLETSATFVFEAKEALALIYKERMQPLEMQRVLEELAAQLLQEKKGKEELALKIGSLLSKLNPSKAIELFEHVLKTSDKKKKEAALFLFSMLTKEKNLESLVQHEKAFTPILEKNQLALFHFIVGRMYLDKKQHQLAANHFQMALKLPLDAPYDRQALASLSYVAKELDSIDILKENYNKCLVQFSKDHQLLSKLEIFLADLLNQHGKQAEALSLLDKALSRDGDHEEAALEKIAILSHLEKFDEAESLTNAFLDKLPKNKPLHEIKISLLKRAHALTKNPMYEEKLSLAVQDALVNAQGFDEKEKFALKILLVKSFLSQEKPLEAIPLCTELLKSNENQDEILALLTYSHLKAHHYDLAIACGEKAKSPEYTKALSLPLFNAYLGLSKERKSSELAEKAANYLYQAFESGLTISLENRIWLFNRLSIRARLFNAIEAAKKAIALIEPLFLEGNFLEGDFAYHEKEAIAASYLYAILDESEKSFSMLGKLGELYKNGFGHHVEEAKLAKAEILMARGQEEEALKLFHELLDAKNKEVAQSAKFYIARSGTYDVNASLATLLELKNMKSAAGEPLHLQAAIEYAELQAEKMPRQSRSALLISLLKDIKKEFLSKDDLYSLDYHDMLCHLPEKKEIFDCYMRYIDGWILTLEANEAKEKEERLVKMKEAERLFSSLDQKSSLFLKNKMNAFGRT